MAVAWELWVATAFGLMGLALVFGIARGEDWRRVFVTALGWPAFVVALGLASSLGWRAEIAVWIGGAGALLIGSGMHRSRPREPEDHAGG